MVSRFLFLMTLLVATMLVGAELEREHRQWQTRKARQVYQKQVLLSEQTRLRLKLQRETNPLPGEANEF